MRTRSAFITAVCFWTASALHSALGAQQATTRSVVEGVYTEEQAKRGAPVYTDTCEACHGAALKGGDLAPSLATDDLVAGWRMQTLADLFLKIKDGMPANEPGKLTAQQAADVLAYMLQSDKFPAGMTELPTDTASLKQIKIEAPKP